MVVVLVVLVVVVVVIGTGGLLSLVVSYIKQENIQVAHFELLVWPHEVEPWFHSWYRGRVETLDVKYNLIFR